MDLSGFGNDFFHLSSLHGKVVKKTSTFHQYKSPLLLSLLPKNNAVQKGISINEIGIYYNRIVLERDYV